MRSINICVHIRNLTRPLLRQLPPRSRTILLPSICPRPSSVPLARFVTAQHSAPYFRQTLQCGCSARARPSSNGNTHLYLLDHVPRWSHLDAKTEDSSRTRSRMLKEDITTIDCSIALLHRKKNSRDFFPYTNYRRNESALTTPENLSPDRGYLPEETEVGNRKTRSKMSSLRWSSCASFQV